MSHYSTTDLFGYSGTHQQSPLNNNQVQNNAGGFVFRLDIFKRLERFLILGSDSNTYYQNAKEITIENAKCVVDCWNEDYSKTRSIIFDISSNNRAPRNSPALFAIALGAVNPDIKVRQAAYSLINSVCRTSTHLFELMAICKTLKKGWGRGFKKAIANWYNSKSDEKLAYQLIKYRQREGFTHEQAIRLSHPKAEETTLERHAMYDWLRNRSDRAEVYYNLPPIIKAHLWAMGCEDNAIGINQITRLIDKFNLPWEALPTWANTKPEIWNSILANGMPITALIRNLGNMTRLHIFEGMHPTKIVCETIENEVEKAKIHPFNLLNAFHTYQSGHGFRGSNSWMPVQIISDTLESAFYRSFNFIEPSGKRIMLALDVSGSMDGNKILNSDLSAREASSAMAMATLRSEENVIVTGFSSLLRHNIGAGIIPLSINAGMSLIDVLNYTSQLPFSGTDCSLPMTYAMANKLNVDAFVIYTDNETFAGRLHPVEALQQYRDASGINDAKLIVVGMTSSEFSIADPDDANMLDVVGFDSNAPSIISDFIRNENN